MKSLKRLFAAVLLLAPLVASPARAASAPVAVHTDASRGYAIAGNTAAAWISVGLVRQDNGEPVVSLGGTVGDGTPLPALPAVLDYKILLVGPGGCPPVPIGFRNQGRGGYTITVAPPSGCTWKSGDYHFILGVRDTVDNTSVSGLGLGVLRIP